MTNSSILIWIDNAILNPSRENFCMTFAMVIQHLSLTDDELAKAIQVPRPTIKRWVRGESCVHPFGSYTHFEVP